MQNKICTAKDENLSAIEKPGLNEFSIQLRASDASKSGNGKGMAVLIGMCCAVLDKNTKGGLVIVGQLNLGGF